MNNIDAIYIPKFYTFKTGDLFKCHSDEKYIVRMFASVDDGEGIAVNDDAILMYLRSKNVDVINDGKSKTKLHYVQYNEQIGFIYCSPWCIITKL
jgi:hypothetical protein